MAPIYTLQTISSPAIDTCSCITTLQGSCNVSKLRTNAFQLDPKLDPSVNSPTRLIEEPQGLDD